MNNLNINVAPYRKAIAAAFGALVTVGTVVVEVIADGSLDFNDLVLIFAAVGTVGTVYDATNTPADA